MCNVSQNLSELPVIKTIENFFPPPPLFFRLIPYPHTDNLSTYTSICTRIVLYSRGLFLLLPRKKEEALIVKGTKVFHCLNFCGLSIHYIHIASNNSLLFFFFSKQSGESERKKESCKKKAQLGSPSPYIVRTRTCIQTTKAATIYRSECTPGEKVKQPGEMISTGLQFSSIFLFRG